MTDDILERRYRALLRSYPAGYRDERADELLEILLADSGRRWPEPRQALALVRGGLRVRAGSASPRPGLVLLWQGLQLAAVAVLALGVLVGIDDLVEAFQFGGLDAPLLVLQDLGPNVFFNAAALAALFLGRQRLAVGFAVAAIVVQTAISQYLFANGMPQWWAPVLALPLLIIGLRRPARVAPLERGNTALVTVGVLALHLIPVGEFWRVDPVVRITALVVTVAAVAVFLWFATADQRLLIAAAPTFLLDPLHRAMTGSLDALQTWPSVAAGVALVAFAVLLASRRRARA
ncbi:hypothetical protein [Actinoplanes utahensis]|uniref:Uncharacterized protein n=1 Tax=Actinoplanes utahensis TaxID=1869 RepID=A0A0A6UBD3_ACTUT|nr:hypothetical protein [Actinoplanes utahensis]KHD72368.1 hypothetical protein MB27_38470 [Actinoplanes utahensis]GIF29558.1 hypothetical protein Aut01nite_25440 [Actinoplanes utahensis]